MKCPSWIRDRTNLGRQLACIYLENLIEQLWSILISRQKLGNPSAHGEVCRTISIFLIVDWVQEESPNVVLLNLRRISNGFLNRSKWLPIDGGESGLDVRGVGNAKVQIAIQGHGQWTHVEGKDIAAGTAKNLLLEGFPRIKYFLGRRYGLPPIVRPPVPACLCQWGLPKLDDSAILVVCDSKREETPLIGVAWRYPERTRMIKH